MRQTKYLFIGGPWDGRWVAVPESYGRAVRVPVRCRDSEIRGPGVDVVLYYAHRIIAPGWLAPLTVYTPGPVHPFAETGTAMPGWVEGWSLPMSSCGPWRYLDNDEGMPGTATREAIRARGCRP
jgi:hypothetical protein